MIDLNDRRHRHSPTGNREEEKRNNGQQAPEEDTTTLEELLAELDNLTGLSAVKHKCCACSTSQSSTGTAKVKYVSTSGFLRQPWNR